MKFKRIRDTKFPTEQQLKDIISNLKTKFPKDKFVISSELSSTRLTYCFYSLYRLTNKKEYYPIIGLEWSNFLSEYRDFMKGEKDV